MRVSIGAALLLAVSAGGARAAGGGADLTGRASLGGAERPVALRLACDTAGAGLSATLTVPDFEAMTKHFDFDGLEGPGGSAGLLAEIRVLGGNGIRSVRTRASGAVAAEPATSFTLTVAGARRGEDPLRGIAPALPEAGAKLTWTQSSPRKGDAPLVATFSVGEPEAGNLKAALGPCLGR